MGEQAKTDVLPFGRRWWTSLLLAAGVALGALASDVEPAEARERQYSGTVVGDPLATVNLTVEVRRGKPRSAIFGATDVQLFYDDGTTARESRLPRNGSFVGRRVFRYQEFELTESASFFYEVQGRLLAGGRAKGYLLYMANYHEQAGAGSQMLPDGSTHGRVRWTASRTG
jgi:hypothetical protein